jgi:hypothetical protein
MNNAGPTHLRKQYGADKLINRHLTAPVIKNVEARTDVRHIEGFSAGRMGRPV